MQSRRTICLLVANWAFVALPGLCMGGGLEHHCDCEGGMTVEHEHEGDCHDDPCHGVAIGAIARSKSDDLLVISDVVPVAILCDTKEETPSADTRQSQFHWGLSSPFPPSDRPLLI